MNRHMRRKKAKQNRPNLPPRIADNIIAQVIATIGECLDCHIRTVLDPEIHGKPSEPVFVARCPSCLTTLDVTIHFKVEQ